MLDKTVGPKYGKAVLQAFMQILPKPKPDDVGSVAKVIQFVQRVDYLATPVQGSQKTTVAACRNPKPLNCPKPSLTQIEVALLMTVEFQRCLQPRCPQDSKL